MKRIIIEETNATCSKQNSRSISNLIQSGYQGEEIVRSVEAGFFTPKCRLATLNQSLFCYVFILPR